MQLKSQETAHFIARNVATMTHALEDKLFEIQVEQVNESADCSVRITYHIPEADIAEANDVLDANPGKRIMLAGQGYQLPEAKRISAIAKVSPPDLALHHEDTLQSASLGRNRASIELMYATLAQSRALITPATTNTLAWPSDLTAQQIKSCETSYVSEDNITEACSCRIEALSARISPRQLNYIHYLASDPYSSATGALSSYNSLSDQINFDCRLKRR